MASYARMTNDALVDLLEKRGFNRAEVEALSKKELVETLEKDDQGEFDEEGIDPETAVASDAGEEPAPEPETEEGEEEATLEEEQPEAAEMKGPAYDVVRRVGEDVHFIRSFSEAVHGKEFKTLAANYINKADRVADHFLVESAKIKAVIVRYREVVKSLDGSRTKQDKAARIEGGLKRKAEAVSMANAKRTDVDRSVILVDKGNVAALKPNDFLTAAAVSK